MDPFAQASLRDYLLDGERIVVAVRRHWVQILEPSVSAAAGLAVTLWVEAVVTPNAVFLARLAWWCWFALVVRLVWYAVEWRRDLFIATDKRLVLAYGLVTRKVAMMPLTKVTDMSFVRTVPGRLLGYGKFVLESAGQEQALREVNWIPDAHRTYRAICAEIFGVDDHDRVLTSTTEGAESGWDDWDEGSGGQGGGPGGPGRPDGPGSRGAPADPDHSRQIPVHQPASETLYRSEDQDRRERGPDTGPVRYYPPDPR